MFSIQSIVLIAAAIAYCECSVAPSAPLVAPAQIGYAHAVPQNIPPYAAQVNVFSRAPSPLIAAAPVAAQFAGPAPFYSAPYAAPPAHLAAFSAPAPFNPYPAPVPAPYAQYAAYPAPFAPYEPYLARAPLAAPAFVR